MGMMAGHGDGAIGLCPTVNARVSNAVGNVNGLGRFFSIFFHAAGRARVARFLIPAPGGRSHGIAARD